MIVVPDLLLHRTMFTSLRPNNSLKLTRRAALSGLLVTPADVPQNPGEFARFRRAA
jgi:hypothetical protein